MFLIQNVRYFCTLRKINTFCISYCVKSVENYQNQDVFVLHFNFKYTKYLTTLDPTRIRYRSGQVISDPNPEVFLSSQSETRLEINKKNFVDPNLTKLFLLTQNPKRMKINSFLNKIMKK